MFKAERTHHGGIYIQTVNLMLFVVCTKMLSQVEGKKYFSQMLFFSNLEYVVHNAMLLA